MRTFSSEMKIDKANKGLWDLLGRGKKTRYPRRLKKAVAQFITKKKANGGLWEITIVFHLKENTKWNKRANRMVEYQSIDSVWILPFKDGLRRMLRMEVGQKEKKEWEIREPSL